MSGTNEKQDTRFRLTHPVSSVKSCRLMWASVPSAVTTATAVYLKVGGYPLDKVQAAVPVRTSSMSMSDFAPGRGHFFVIPNGIETYVPKNKTDEAVWFTPELPNVTEIEVELYPLPSPTRELLDLSGDKFSLLLEFISSHR